MDRLRTGESKSSPERPNANSSSIPIPIPPDFRPRAFHLVGSAAFGRVRPASANFAVARSLCAVVQLRLQSCISARAEWIARRVSFQIRRWNDGVFSAVVAGRQEGRLFAHRRFLTRPRDHVTVNTIVIYRSIVTSAKNFARGLQQRGQDIAGAFTCCACNSGCARSISVPLVAIAPIPLSLLGLLLCAFHELRPVVILE